MLGAGVAARHIGVETGKPVDETLRDQEIEGAVDGDRRRGPAAVGKAIDDLVGADGTVAFGDDLQHPPPLRGQPRLPGVAQPFRVGEDGAETPMVIVVGARKGVCRFNGVFLRSWVSPSYLNPWRIGKAIDTL